MSQYYREQLRNHLTMANIKVKFVSDNGETKWMDINKESVKEITDYFELLKTLNNL